MTSKPDQSISVIHNLNYAGQRYLSIARQQHPWEIVGGRVLLFIGHVCMTKLTSRMASKFLQSIAKRIFATGALVRRAHARRALRSSVQQELFFGQTLDFRRLEPRRVLNASFEVVGTGLDLTTFTAGDSLTISYDGVGDTFDFTLNAGETWIDVANANVATGSNVLSIAAASLTGLLNINSALVTNVTFDGNLVPALDSVQIDTQGDVTNTLGTTLTVNNSFSVLDSASIDLGSNAVDTLNFGTLNFNAAGTAYLTEQSDITLFGANTGTDINLTAVGVGSDVEINGTIVALEDLLVEAEGNVTQTAAITATGLGLTVDGTTTLNSVANNVTTLATDNGGETLYTDADGLTVGAVTVDGVTVTGITTSGDDVKLTVLLGDLAINNAIALGVGDLFLDVTGNVTQTAAITAAGLGLMVDGTSTLNNVANNVTTIAADSGGETLYTDADGLTVGAVTVDGMTVTGITTSGDDVKLTVLLGDLAINNAIALGVGDLFLDVTGNVTQTAAITAAGLGLMIDGTTTLNNVANNVTTIAADNGGETLYTDADGLTVGAVTVDGMTVTGITTSGDDVKLTVLLGDLAVNQAIALGVGDLFLDVTGNVTQTAAITAAGLGLMVDGTTTLNNVANNVTTIAANNGGETLYTDANGLTVGAVTVDGMTVTGITTSGDDVKLTVLLGDLGITSAIAIGVGDLFLDVTGNVTQTAAITAAGLGLMVDGTTTLNNVANNVTTIAADNGGETLYTDASGLTVGAVTVDGMTVTGITTSGDDVKLTVLLSDLAINQAIALGVGDLFLDVTGNVTQTAAITAAGLGLMVDGTTTLNNVANNVTTIAADNGGETLYTDANGLTVGAVTVDGMTVTGITTSGDDVKLTVLLGDLWITSAITLGAGDLFLDVTGNVTQTAAITAAGLGLMVDGTTTLNNVANNVTTIAADNGGETLYTDADGLTVGAVTVDGMTVTGITTSGDDVKLTVLLGDLAINNAIALGVGDLFLDVTGNVTQTAAITAAGLGLMVDGTTTLNNVANNATTIAADNGGETLYTDANGLTVGAVTVDGMTVTGITTSGDDVKLTVLLGDLGITSAITLGAGDLFLDVTGNVTQTAAITAGGLGLMVDGTTTLNNVANNVTTIAADNGGETLYTDANALTVGAVTVDGMTVTGITTSGDDVKLTVLLGNLAINNAIALGVGDLFLDVTGNVTQTAAITAAGLGLQVDGDTTLNTAANNVTTLAADNGGEILYTNLGDLTIGSVTVAGSTVVDVVTPGNISLTASSIIDGDPLPEVGPIDYDVSGADVTLTATTGSIGGITGDFFCDTVFNLLEVFASGNLVASATMGTVALHADVLGTITITAITGALLSDGDLDVTGANFAGFTNLILIADADNSGLGTLFIDSPLSVLGNLRLQGADIDAGVLPIVLQADRILFVSGESESIQVSDSLLAPLTDLILDARTDGSLTVAATGNVELLDLDCDNVALASINGVGSVTLTSTDSVLISDDVIAGFDGVATSTGSISITATTDLTINDAVVSDIGSITLQAGNDVLFGGTPSTNDNLLVGRNDDLRVVTTVAGTIEVSADFNNDNNGAGGQILMTDGSRIIAGRGTAADYVPGIDGFASATTIDLSAVAIAGNEVSLNADENITISSVQSADNGLNAIRATSRNGAIVDGGDTQVDLVANFTGALVTLRAVTGIGNGNALETEIYAVDANNSPGVVIPVSGDVVLNEIVTGGDLNVVNANNSAGDVRIQVDGGTLEVVAAGFMPNNADFEVTTVTGNVLLSASQDVVVNSAATSGSGHVTLIAGDDVDINAVVSTGGTGDIYVDASNSTTDAVPVEVDGINIDAAISTNTGSILLASLQDIRTTSTLTSIGGSIGMDASRDVLQNANVTALAGDVGVNAGSRNYTMAVGTSTSALTNIVATAGDGITLGLLSAANVGLSAGSDIADGNGNGVSNVDAANLSVRAGGRIGSSADPIDTTVFTIAALSVGTIHVSESNDLVVGAVAVVTATINVSQVNFDATTSPQSLTTTVAALTGITTTDSDVKLVVGGNLDVNEAIAVGDAVLFLDVTGDVNQADAGVITADGLGLIVGGTTTLTNLDNDVLTFAADNVGETQYTDADDLIVGIVIVDEFTLDAMTVTGITTVNSNVELTVRLNDLTIAERILVGTGDIDLTVNGFVISTLITPGVIGNHLTIDAGEFAHLLTEVKELTVTQVNENGSITGSAIFQTNAEANAKGDDFLTTLTTGMNLVQNVDGGKPTPAQLNVDRLNTGIAALAPEFQYDLRFHGDYALFVINTGDLIVHDVSSGTASPTNLYIETDGTANLNVAGTIKSATTTTAVNADEGGIVLIAGGDLKFTTPTAMLLTELVIGPPTTVVRIDQLDLLAKFFNGGAGVGEVLSTEFVTLDPFSTKADVNQQVLLQFGTTNELGFTAIIGYADGAIEGQVPFLHSAPSTASTNGLVTRSSPLEGGIQANAQAFLDLNTTLPTNAIVRRADNVFLFQDSGNVDLAVETNKDLTVETSPILNVKSLGGLGGALLPTELLLVQPMFYVIEPFVAPITVLTQAPMAEIELPTPTQKRIDVAIYEVKFDDDNENGQVDEAELPTYEIVLARELDEESKNSRIVIEPAKGGKTPTQEDIEREKTKLKNNPNQPAGAYAIIKTDTDGSRTVLDVFGIRDWQEEQPADAREIKPDAIKVPQLEPFKPSDADDASDAEIIPPPVAGPQATDTSRLAPLDHGQGHNETRFASAGLLLGSLWMLRKSHGSNDHGQSSVARIAEQSQDYSRHARRTRQLNK